MRSVRSYVSRYSINELKSPSTCLIKNLSLHCYATFGNLLSRIVLNFSTKRYEQNTVPFSEIVASIPPSILSAPSIPGKSTLYWTNTMDSEKKN